MKNTYVPYQAGLTLHMVLTRGEARLLRDILSSVGGDPNSSRRGLADGMMAAFDDAGIRWEPSPDLTGRIELTDRRHEV